MTKRRPTTAGLVAGILTMVLPGAAFALPMSEVIRGREALLFTSGLSILTLALFAGYLIDALWHKRS